MFKIIACLMSLLPFVSLLLPTAQAADDDLSLLIVPAIAHGAQGPLPDTGVTLCYNATTIIPCPAEGEPFYGQDAQYNPADRQRSYTNHGDGTVTDRVTGLMWMQSDDGIARNWPDADSYCQANTTGGYDDWRLPTSQELINLLHWANHNPSPAIDPVFSCLLSPYWSSNPRAEFPDVRAWCLDFFDGHEMEEHKTNEAFYVRCVRGANVTPRFKSISGTEVYDSTTGLTWRKTDNGLRYTWEEALAFCENMDENGHTDWRLPNIIELHSILDLSRWEPAINPVFDCQTGLYFRYWTSTHAPGSTASALFVAFEKGGVNVTSKLDTLYVRCVHGGQ